MIRSFNGASKMVLVHLLIQRALMALMSCFRGGKISWRNDGCLSA
jgi:hypothetical protein